MEGDPSPVPPTVVTCSVLWRKDAGRRFHGQLTQAPGLGKLWSEALESVGIAIREANDEKP
jgi:hypothetical protein